jgi:hypothetical protein
MIMSSFASEGRHWRHCCSRNLNASFYELGIEFGVPTLPLPLCQG